VDGSYAWSHGEQVLRLQKSELSLLNRAFYKDMDVELLSGTRSLHVLHAPMGGNVRSAVSPLAACFLAREMPYTQCDSLAIYLIGSTMVVPLLRILVRTAESKIAHRPRHLPRTDTSMIEQRSFGSTQLVMSCLFDVLAM